MCSESTVPVRYKCAVTGGSATSRKRWLRGPDISTCRRSSRSEVPPQCLLSNRGCARDQYTGLALDSCCLYYFQLAGGVWEAEVIALDHTWVPRSWTALHCPGCWAASSTCLCCSPPRAPPDASSGFGAASPRGPFLFIFHTWLGLGWGYTVF